MLRSLLKSIGGSAARQRVSGEFVAALARLVAEKLRATEEDNVDRARWLRGAEEIAPVQEWLSGATLQDLLTHAHGYEQAHDLFEDDASRALFVQLIAYRLLGHTHVRLPTDCSGYREAVARADALPTRPGPFTGQFGPLSDFDIEFDGERIDVTGWRYIIRCNFLLRQYYFERAGVKIQPRRGDRVIDAGACFGETALAFAVSVGPQGRVAAFEIDPGNMAVARRNLESNAELARRIDLRECALAGDATPLYLGGSGTGSFVTTIATGHALAVETIDGYLQSGGLDRVDFIKMDIEGAEHIALIGAEKTLRRDRPTLAISIYHRPDDLWKIALWLDGLHLGYRFYLDHYTTHHEETVLYATADR